MSFQLPDEFSKPELSDSAKKVYTRYLNKLAVLGFDTPQLVKERAFAVVPAIKQLYPGDDANSRTHRRYFISAIYNVLPLYYRMKWNPYYMLVKQSRPPVDDGWDEDKKRYLAKKAKRLAEEKKN
jgi:hypothetical protein